MSKTRRFINLSFVLAIMMVSFSPVGVYAGEASAATLSEGSEPTEAALSDTVGSPYGDDGHLLNSRERVGETSDVPVPLPHDCGGVAPSDPDACCAYGYVYYGDQPVSGAGVRIESAHDTFTTTTAGGEESSDPYYAVDLSSNPLSVSVGDVITITASYGEMVSARTWTVQESGQQVDVGVHSLLSGGPVTFTQRTVDEGFDNPLGSVVKAADVDGDGDVDLVGAANDNELGQNGTDIAWWENDGNQQFTTHAVAADFDGALCAHPADVDGDGDVDILGAGNNVNDITWWENDGNESFTEHTIDGSFWSAHAVYASDVDGDGDVDVLGAGLSAGIAWWENDGSETFTEHTIDGGFSGARSVYATDVDGDGDVDVLGAGQSADDITWWENDGSETFTEHTIDGNFDRAFWVYATDVDGDGDVDVIGTANTADDIAWWENDGSESFTKHLLDSDFDGAEKVHAADLDGDGDVDIVGAARGLDQIAWWENDDGGSFSKRVVGEHQGADSVYATDVDGDGDTDVAVMGYGGGVAWYENLSRSSGGWHTELVDDVGYDIDDTSLALDSSEYPHIAYYDYTNRDLLYAYYDGTSWYTETVHSAGNTGAFPSIALDSNDHPHVTWRDYETQSVMYGYHDGSSWQIETVSSGSWPRYTSLALDSDDHPHISYFTDVDWGSHPDSLMYARHDGSSWQIEQVDGTIANANTSIFTALTLDALDRPHIAYSNGFDLVTKYAWKDASWHLDVVYDDGQMYGEVAIELDSSGYPHIVQTDRTRDALWYFWQDGGSWHAETLGTVASGHCGDPSIAVDASDGVHVSYPDLENDVKYAHLSAGEWTTETVDAGEAPALVLDAGGTPHVSYYDVVSGELRYAERVSSDPIESIMADALLVEHLESGATVDTAGIVADADYSATNQSGFAVWEKPLGHLRACDSLDTLGVTIRYAISPDGDLYVGSVGLPSEALAVLIGYDDWWVKELSLRDIVLYRLLRLAYEQLETDGYVTGGEGLNGALDMWNKYGEQIQVLYSALMMFTTYNGEWAWADRLDVWDPSGPGATTYTGDTWRTLDLACSGNTRSFVYSHVYNDSSNSTYMQHDGATVASRGTSIGCDDHILLDGCPASVEMGGNRTWSEIDTSLHAIVVGGSISSTNHAEYPANGGNPTPSILSLPPRESWDAPVASFTATPLDGTAPLDVSFIDQSAGDVTAWTWAFGDGGISGGRHPSYTYESAGTYTVSLTVSGPGGSDTETKTDYVTAEPAASSPPTATIDSVTPDPAVQGQDLIYFNGSGSDNDESGAYVTAYEWTSSLDGQLSAQEDFTVQASELSTGTHTIAFRVQDDEGDWSQEVTRTLTVEAPQADVRTLILVNRDKLASLYSGSEADQVVSKLGELAAHASVEGLVVEVEDDASVASAYAEWDADPTSTAKANAVAGAIKAVVDARWTTYPDLEYLVIVGDDRAIPFRRVLDQTRHPESHYNSVSSTSTTGAALRDDMSLTDDYYADAAPTVPDNSAWDGHDLYIPDLGTGRLIESPGEIIDQVDVFLADDGVAVDDAAVTGYDFLQDGAQATCSELSEDGLATDCTLIGEEWDRANFIDQVLNTRHDVVSINGHAHHYVIGTPSGSVSSSDVVGAAADHTGAIFYTVGCHSGLNVSPDNPYEDLDTAQALIQQGASYVANTGYGWGYRASVGLSEQLMLDFTERLVYGQSAKVGQALAAAKQEYYLNERGFDYYDEKILIESTLYGLPMVRYDSSTAAAAQLEAQAQGRGATAIKTEERLTVVGEGLTVNSFSYQFPALTAESTEEGLYYTFGGLAYAGDGEPIQPKYTADLSFPETEAHGVVFRGGVYTDTASFDPVVDRAITETSTLEEPAFASSGWYPALPHRLNRLERAASAGDKLVTLLGQFNAQDQKERLYDQLSFDVYYHTGSDDWTGPTITAVSGSLGGEGARVTVEAGDAMGIEAVVVAYTDGTGTWDSVSLTESGGEWSGSFDAGEGTRFFVQAVDGSGNVSVSDNGGTYFEPVYDFSGDGVVSVADVALVAERWRMTETDPDWDAHYDLDGDGTITILDIMEVAAHWGDTCG